MCLTGIESGSPTSQLEVASVAAFATSTSTWRQTKRRPWFGSSAPGQQPRLAQHLKAVADPEHRPAVGGERGDRLHRGCETRDRPGAQVVAVGEAAGDDHRVEAGEVAVAVPDELRVGDPTAGEHRVALVAGARELKNPEPHRSIS